MRRCCRWPRSLGPASVRESAPAYLFAASTIGLAVVLYLGYASLVILGLVCILCVVTYAAVIALFLISGAATSDSDDDACRGAPSPT